MVHVEDVAAAISYPYCLHVCVNQEKDTKLQRQVDFEKQMNSWLIFLDSTRR